jgi:Putative auto-transporter adhesin, head GIN domain
MRKSVAVVIAAAALSGCQVHAKEEGGPTASRNYEVGNFQEIELAGPYDIDIRTGAKPSVSAKGSQKLLERTVVEVRGDKLVIRPERHGGFFNFGWSTNGSATFTVTVPQLSKATLAGSGDIRIDKVQGSSFEGAVAGSGGINVGSVDVQQLKIAIAGHGDAKLGAGKAQSAKYEIAGHGNVDAGQVQTQSVEVSIAGSGDVRAYASGTADVDIMGSGDVDVAGGAKCKINKAGSGDVRCT